MTGLQVTIRQACENLLIYFSVPAQALYLLLYSYSKLPIKLSTPIPFLHTHILLCQVLNLNPIFNFAGDDRHQKVMDSSGKKFCFFL